jgi:hypothetical protein
MGPKMADFWDWIVPNVAGETNAKVAPARAQYTGANGRLDPNAISAETLAGYGVPSQVTEDAAPYLSTYRMGNDIAKSALTPPERGMGETIGGLLQALSIPVSYAQGNKAFGSQVMDDNIMTRDAKRRTQYEDAQRESVLKNAQNLTGNVDQIIAEQQKARAAARAAKDALTNRENVADRYNLEGDARTRYALEGKFDPLQGLTDDQKEYKSAQAQGYTGTLTDFLAMKKSGGSVQPYRWSADGTKQEYVPGGSADPKMIAEQSLARGGRANVPPPVRTAGIGADQAYQALIPLLDEYEKTITDPKTGTGRVFFNEVGESDKVNQQRKNIQLQLKELYNLGVLNGPDLALMNQMLFDPSVSLNPMQLLGGLTNKITGGGAGTDTSSLGNMFYTEDRTKQSVARLKETLRGIRNSKTRILGMDDIGEDGKPIPGSAKAYAGTSTAPSAADGTSVEPGPSADYSGMSNEDLARELELRGM